MSTPTHDDILATFRQELFSEGILHEGDTVGTDDETLLRFLRARKFNLKLSKEMLRECQHWRGTIEGVGIDELYRRIDPFDYPEREAVFDCWPMWFHKTDKKGRPLNIHFFGGMDLNKLYKQCTPEKHWQTVLVNCESLPREVLPAAARKAGRPIGTVFVIVDLKGFGISQFWQMKSLARSSFQISQDYYPETMGQLAIVNAPPSFTAIWSVIKPWLSKETAEKVDILGHNYKDVLLKLVDADSLPSSLGGTCTCEHAGGCHLSGAGPWLDGRVGWGPNAKKQQESRIGVNGVNGVKEEEGLDMRSNVEISPSEDNHVLSTTHTFPDAGASEVVKEDVEPGHASTTTQSAAEIPRTSEMAAPPAPFTTEGRESAESTEGAGAPGASGGAQATPQLVAGTSPTELNSPAPAVGARSDTVLPLLSLSRDKKEHADA